MREARCPCGQLRLTARGEPSRVSVCHCLDCQRRSGSVFATRARFPEGAVDVAGETQQWARPGEHGGGAAVFRFCPQCVATLFYTPEDEPGTIAVAVGAFADPRFAAPGRSVCETRKHAWVTITGELDHHD